MHKVTWLMVMYSVAFWPVVAICDMSVDPASATNEVSDAAAADAGRGGRVLLATARRLA